MANLTQVNKVIKQRFPELDIEIVRGEGYVYFIGEDGENIEPICTHPFSTLTDDLCRIVVSDVEHYIYS